ncbi:MAG: endonuclease/exonuclease/phosphatase family protein [Paludibacteraceae bacterium]|nr:endonuclease/exonuclease/phosphatase family protein [Paludibacteraceae bacterium]
MKRTIYVLLLVVLSMGIANAKKTPKNEVLKGSYLVECIAFYNLENLFDTIHDEGKNDYEYLPDGGMKWDGVKYNYKIKNMAYAVSRLGEDVTPGGPACIGVAEVENLRCLQDLADEVNAKYNRNYIPILLEGPDRRGVDVGFLYNPDKFKPVSIKGHELKAHYADGGVVKTRLQLLVSGYLHGEKLHIIVNHWPSRYGGELSSRPTRDTAAMLTRQICDSIYLKEPSAKIIIMGDLNDDPDNHSCKDVLEAKLKREDATPQGFYNCFWQILKSGTGTLAYNGGWNLFDQIIINGNLANTPDRKHWSYWKAEVFNKPFLTYQEGKDKGTPRRTLKAGVWDFGGYGDHYPTMIYLVREKK